MRYFDPTVIGTEVHVPLLYPKYELFSYSDSLVALGPQKLRKQFVLQMDIRKLCDLGSRTIQLGRCCDEHRPVNSPPSSSPSEGHSKLRWIVLLMKFKKEKKKMFHVPYDSFTYSQNFDQGFAWDEPDSFSRSFSVRFADPNRILLMK